MELLRLARKLWAKPAIRRIVILGILLVTILSFARFFQQHPDYFTQLGKVSPWTIIWVFILNIAMTVVLVAANEVTVKMCGKTLHWKENFQLTAYSSLVNFFGPLQSGPGVKMAYLKTRHNIRIRDFVVASVMLLGFFAFFSALALFAGTRPWWQTAGALLVVAALSYAIMRAFIKRDKHRNTSQLHFTPMLVGSIAFFAFLQVVITCGWYYVELQAVDPGIHFSQAVSYSGAANFSTYVSITPDGVGIRESFLLLSQHIHHVPTGDIASANVIDRAVYVIYLLALLAILSTTHVAKALRLTDLRRSTAKS